MGYSMKDLKKMGGSGNVRMLKLEDGISKKIWLPIDDVCYKRTHFNVKENYKNSSKAVIDCCNNTYGMQGEGCPICDEIQALWKKWRDTAGKDAKKEITDRINKMVSEDFYFNAICVDDPDKFVVVRFTKSKYLEIEKIAERYGLQNILWLYKYSKDSNRYTLTELTDEMEKISGMQKILEDLKSREYDNGGPCDLEAALVRKIDADTIRNILKGHGNTDDEEHISDEPAKSTSKSTKTKEKEPVLSEESTSLDDLSLDTPSDKKEDKLNTDESLESMDIGELGLDDLTLDVSMIKITYETITEKVKAKNAEYLKKIAAYLIEEKKISKKDSINDQIKELAAYVKANVTVEVPESKLS